MKSGYEEWYFLYFICWGVLAISFPLLVNSRPTPEEKKKWHDRLVILTGIVVGGFMVFIVALWENYVASVVVAGAVVLIAYLNVRHTFFCSRCGKMSWSYDWFCHNSPHHCPQCGKKLR